MNMAVSYVWVRKCVDPKIEHFLLARTQKAARTYMQWTVDPMRTKFLPQKDAAPYRLGIKDKPKMPCHIFVRDPLERLVSCWNYFTSTEDPGGAGHQTVNKDFEGFLRQVLNQHPPNGHWHPQTETHYSEQFAVFMPTIAWRLDDFDVIKHQLLPGGNMGRGEDKRNEKPHPSYSEFEVSAELDERVRTKYEEDSRLYAAIPPGRSISVSNWPSIG